MKGKLGRGTVRGEELREKRPSSLINGDLPHASPNISLYPLCRNRQPGSPGGIAVQPHPPGGGGAPAVSTVLLQRDRLRGSVLGLQGHRSICLESFPIIFNSIFCSVSGFSTVGAVKKRLKSRCLVCRGLG